MQVSDTVTLVKHKRSKVVLRRHFGGVVTVEFDVDTLAELGLPVSYLVCRRKGFVAIKNGPVFELNQFVDWGDK